MRRQLPRLAMIVVVLAGGGVAACGTSTGPAATSSPTPSPTSAADRITTSASPAHPSAAPAGRASAVRAARKTLQAYLDAWRTHGAAYAARLYLSPEQQPGAGGGLFPVLLAGTVRHSALSSQESADRLTLEVSLQLHFAGDPGAWDEGANDRFVTATRSGPGTPFRLAFATSP